MRFFYWYFSPVLFLLCLLAGVIESKGFFASLRHPLGLGLVAIIVISLIHGAWAWGKVEQLRKKYPADYNDWGVAKALWLGPAFQPKVKNAEFADDLYRLVQSNFWRNAVFGLGLVVALVLLGYSGYFRTS